MHKFFILLLSLVIVVPVLQAQTLSTSTRDLSRFEGILQKPTSSTTTAPIAPILERPVDPEKYILGPGDVLNIIILGQSETNLQAMVSPEGTVFITSVGVIDISGKNLVDAKDEIIKKVKTKYLSEDVNIQLVQLRSFRVSVTGSVEHPGLVTVNALNRVSEAIKLGGGFKKPIDVRAETKQVAIETPVRNEISTQTSELKRNVDLNIEPASQRRITVRRRNGEVLQADILKYNLAGDLEANPHLLDGDVIIVPNEEVGVGRLYITGAVRYEHDFEYAPGDKLMDLIAMAHGFKLDADTTAIELVRFKQGTTEITSMILNLDAGNPDEREKNLNLQLLPDDRIFVRAIPDYNEGGNIEIKGEVKYPGFYALKNRSATLSDIIEKTGGFTPTASLRNAYVVRRDRKDIIDPEFERLQKMSISDMTDIEREYFKIKSRQRIGGMGVNFTALFEENDRLKDIVLKDRDLIVVPAKEWTISITGQVISPGLYPYMPGKTLKKYLDEAGGYNWNARKNRVRVIKRSTSEWMKPDDDMVLEIGDTIFVPEKPERDWWLLTRDIVTILAQIASIYFFIERS